METTILMEIVTLMEATILMAQEIFTNVQGETHSRLKYDDFSF